MSEPENKINYPELGGVHEQRRFYKDGDEIEHPSGNRYKRVDGNWVLVKKPENK